MDFPEYAGGYDPMPQQMYIPEPTPEWYDHLWIIKDLMDMGAVGYFILGCTAIGAITILCFILGRSKYFAPTGFIFKLFSRLMRTWSNLLRGD